MNILHRNIRRFRRYSLHTKAPIALVFLAAVPAAFAQSPFTPGNLVVVQVGPNGGATAPTSAATAMFLDEYNAFTGAQSSPVQQIALTNAGSNIFTGSGTATSEGFVKLSSNGQYLTLGGYRASVGTLAVAGTTSANNPREIARIDGNGNVDTSTILTDAFSANSIRAVASVDGSSFYASGAISGERYSTSGSTTSTQLNTAAPTNIRVTNIFSNQLYVSTGSGTVGIYALGTGTPTTTGQTPTLLLGTGTGSSPYDFAIANNGNTVYVADDRTNGSGGIQKWTRPDAASAFALAYTLSPTQTATSDIGFRGLTGVATQNGFQLYATGTISSGSGNTLLYSILDNSDNIATDAQYNLLATAGTNTYFRGLDFAPSVIPEGGTLVSLSLGLMMLGGAGLRNRHIRNRKRAPVSTPIL